MFEEFWPSISEWKDQAGTFTAALIQPVKESGIIVCGCESVTDSHQLVSFLMKHLAKILLQNKSKSLTEGEDRPNCKNKPLSRKLLKLS